MKCPKLLCGVPDFTQYRFRYWYWYWKFPKIDTDTDTRLSSIAIPDRFRKYHRPLLHSESLCNNHDQPTASRLGGLKMQQGVRSLENVIRSLLLKVTRQITFQSSLKAMCRNWDAKQLSMGFFLSLKICHEVLLSVRDKWIYELIKRDNSIYWIDVQYQVFKSSGICTTLKNHHSLEHRVDFCALFTFSLLRFHF